MEIKFKIAKIQGYGETYIAQKLNITQKEGNIQEIENCFDSYQIAENIISSLEGGGDFQIQKIYQKPINGNDIS